MLTIVSAALWTCAGAPWGREGRPWVQGSGIGTVTAEQNAATGLVGVVVGGEDVEVEQDDVEVERDDVEVSKEDGEVSMDDGAASMDDGEDSKDDVEVGRALTAAAAASRKTTIFASMAKFRDCSEFVERCLTMYMCVLACCRWILTYSRRYNKEREQIFLVETRWPSLHHLWAKSTHLLCHALCFYSWCRTKTHPLRLSAYGKQEHEGGSTRDGYCY